MTIQEMQEFLVVQTTLTTIILAFTAIILVGVLFDLLVHLFNKYIKKGDKND